MNIFALWCDLFEEITSRNLTRETDKLPTISGLASALAAFVRDIPFIVDKDVSCTVGHLSLMAMSASRILDMLKHFRVWIEKFLSGREGRHLDPSLETHRMGYSSRLVIGAVSGAQ